MTNLKGAGILLACLSFCLVMVPRAEARNKLSRSTIQRLSKQMWKGDVMTRARAIDRLGRHHAYQVRPALRKMLTKRLPLELTISCMQALGRLRDKQAHPPIARILRTTRTFHIRVAAMWSLVQIQNKASIPTIARFIDKSYGRRTKEYATWALSRFQDKRIIPYMKKMLNYSFDACKAAKRGLRRFGLLKGRVGCSGKARRKRKQ
jgi:HEAT repeat protein